MSEENKKSYSDMDIIEGSVDDLLNEKIDETQNILGHRWLERGTFGVLIGSSGVGKSVAAMQMAVEAAAGLPVFGIPSLRPLKVMVIQAEDSKNDRIAQVQCIRELAKDPVHFESVRENHVIYTTTRRGYRLFYQLEDFYTDEETGEINCDIDLFIFNPAFAFFEEGASVEDSKDVGFFLRSELLPFLQRMGAAAIVVHHTPKLNNRDTSKWLTNTFTYAGHGSAEWTNAPRAVMTIDSTKSPKVYEFRVAKRGSQSGWEENNGEYIRYFSHAPKCMPMHWIPSTEEEIAESQQESGLTDQDVLNTFSEENPEQTCPEICSRLTKDGFKFSSAQIEAIVGRLINRNKLRKVGLKYVLAKVVKKAERAQERAAETEKQCETVFALIEAAMPGGIITKDLIKTAPSGKDTVMAGIEELTKQNRVRVETTKNGIVETRRFFINQ
jgi:RecA-family ATPase